MNFGFNLENVSIKIPNYMGDSFSIRKSLFSKQTNKESLCILKNINLIIKDGDRIGICGGNGSGKTTLLRLLIGSYYPTSGTISRKGKISSLIDISLGIRPDASGLSNIKFKLKCDGHNYKDEKLINRIIEFSELGDNIFLPVKNYSSGMQMRLAFSIATEISPEILILDEWLSVGDSKFKSKAEDRILSLVGTTKILIIASHDKALLEQKCDRIIHMKEGSITSDLDLRLGY